jgi:hypothetical protein
LYSATEEFVAPVKRYSFLGTTADQLQSLGGTIHRTNHFSRQFNISSEQNAHHTCSRSDDFDRGARARTVVRLNHGTARWGHRRTQAVGSVRAAHRNGPLRRGGRANERLPLPLSCGPFWLRDDGAVRTSPLTVRVPLTNRRSFGSRACCQPATVCYSRCRKWRERPSKSSRMNQTVVQWSWECLSVIESLIEIYVFRFRMY